jgi:iron complex transport system ATP-binding protein
VLFGAVACNARLHPAFGNWHWATENGRFMPDPVLSIEGLTFGYEASRPVVEDLTISLQPGRVCVLLGPNAAGKSTLLGLILGQLQPWRGRALVQGMDVANLSPARRAGLVSFVPQQARVRLAFTVAEVVAMGRHALGDNEAAVEFALRECRLLDLAGRVYRQLSVGQQQRVLVARALAQAQDGGSLMLLDEPTSGMDLLHVQRTMSLLRRRSQQGLAVLVVAQDLNLAARWADEVWLMNAGRLVAAGPWQQVLKPEILSPVYGLTLKALKDNGADRPFLAPQWPE